MRYTWSTYAQSTFFQSPHRARYVACDFQLNPPPKPTPLYCIQVASGSRYPLYTTTHTSFILLRSDPLYFGSVQDLEPVIGRPKRRPKGSDSAHRLAQVHGIWQEPSADPQLQPFAYTNLQDIYDAIVTTCESTVASSSMTSGALLNLLPRALYPEAGTTLGHGTAVLSSRTGGRLDRSQHTEASV
jgi:hypothetical protein